MTRTLPLLVALGFLLAACAAQARVEPPSAAPPTVGPTASPDVTPTATEMASATPLQAASPTPLLISEVLPAVQHPEPGAVRGGTSLSVPDGTAVVWGGCASDGRCYPYNFYWAPTREVVMQPGEGGHKVQHELCHAHQHQSINGGAPLPPSDYDLESWHSTPEGQSFSATVSGLPWPWSHSAVNTLEDFAWTCAYWYVDPARLLQSSPQRYDWAAANLP
jgi:hypothetical protein